MENKLNYRWEERDRWAGIKVSQLESGTEVGFEELRDNREV